MAEGSPHAGHAIAPIGGVATLRRPLIVLLALVAGTMITRGTPPRAGEDGMSDPVYAVVSPLGDERDAARGNRTPVGARPLDVLEGKRLGLVWTEFYNGDTVLRAFRDHLSQRHPHLEFVEMAPGRGLSWGDLPDPSIAELAREHGIDGAIVAAGC